MNPTNNLLKKALYYIQTGLSVIPLQPKGKTPLVPWTEYQTKLATEEQIKTWWTRWPDANIGIVTGKYDPTIEAGKWVCN